MRTVDPEVWCRKLKRPANHVTRGTRFGQQADHGFEMRLRASLQDAATEFWHNCSHGVAKYFNIDRMNKYERCRHIAVLVLTVIMGILIIVHNYNTMHKHPPLIISLQAIDTPIHNLKFPAVALCSNGIISKKALKNYTQYLYSHPKNKEYSYTRSEIEYNLLNLGALLTLALPPIKVNFERFFRDVEPNYNITDIMFKFSSNCSTLLRRCSWRGKVKDCDSLFAVRLTALGFCCVFNSRYQPVDFGREPEVLNLIGQDFGLGVVVQEVRDEFAYMRRPVYGMEMLLFAGDEYPLLESGDVRMYPLQRNASLYFNIRAYTQYPADEIRYFSEEWRGCRMNGGGLSWCLTECRRETAEALCGCVPYALQPQSVGPPPDVPTCTLSELSCLNKHREKFMYLYPGEDAGPELSQELQDALDCSHCLVLCKRELYSAEISYSLYGSKPRMFRNFLSEGLTLVNSSVIRLFYNMDHQEWYKVEAYTRWYEVIVKLSTLWMVVTGVTILNYTELLYHCTFRWVHHFVRRTRIAKMQPAATSM